MEIDWKAVGKILVVRLRSIGDTVLSTPSLLALREFAPDKKIDILLEDWVAPVLEGFEPVDEVISVPRSAASRASTAFELRRRKYDLVFNFHGGTTSGFLVGASGAGIRIGYEHFRLPSVYTHRFPSAAEFWGRLRMHSAEQQLAMLGFAGVPVEVCPKTSLAVEEDALEAVELRLGEAFGSRDSRQFALIHPSAAYDTKRWRPAGFAEAIEHLMEKGIESILVSTEAEKWIADEIQSLTGRGLKTFVDLRLPEVTALASRSALFLGNDSGIAHIAAAVGTPSVVVFGSSNSDHWRPWTNAPNRIVFNQYDCQPCPGDYCREFGDPKCILSVESRQVTKAIEEVFEEVGRI